MRSNLNHVINQEAGMVPQLRAYQKKAKDDVRSAFAGGAESVLLVSGTGTGKTTIFCDMTRSAAEKSRRVLLMAHRQELVGQISDTLARFGIPHGIIAQGRLMDRQAVQVGMVQSIARRLALIDRPDLIVVDECHHVLGSTYRRILDHFKTKVLGVTATPARTDGLGLGEIFKSMVLGPSIREMMDQGYLSKYRLFCPPQHFSLTGIKTTAGDYNRGQLSSELDRSIVTGDAVDHYVKHRIGRAIAFCVSVDHAQHVAEQFTAAGVPSASIDGTMAKTERNRITSEFEAGKIRVLSSCDLISEGYDVPAVEAAILLRPTQSLIVYLQQIGRALRPIPGKIAVILDHAGNSLRYGLPDEDRNWSLDGWKGGGKSALEKKIAIRHCKKCFAVYEAKHDTCPFCGVGSQEARTLETRDGQLVEITEEMVREGWLRCAQYTEALGSCKTPADIREMAKAKNYRPGWAIHQVSQQFNMSKVQAAIALGYKAGAAARLLGERHE